MKSSRIEVNRKKEKIGLDRQKEILKTLNTKRTAASMNGHAS